MTQNEKTDEKISEIDMKDVLSIKESLNSCQSMCVQSSDQELDVPSKNEKSEIFEDDLRRNLQGSKQEIRELFASMMQKLYLQPILNYIDKSSGEIKNLKAVLANFVEDYIDLWFVIDENDFETEKQISELCFNLTDIFTNTKFDYCDLIWNRSRVSQLLSQGFLLIHNKVEDIGPNGTRKPMEI